MRFAEKMLLGSTLIQWEAGCVGKVGGPGCALAMVCAADGDKDYSAESLTRFVPDAPWLRQRTVTPCECPTCPALAEIQNVRRLITHLFDEHVMKDRTWTIERLADWVDQFEPRETGQAEFAEIAEIPALSERKK